MPKFQSTPAAECQYPALQSPRDNYEKTGQEFTVTLLFPKAHPWVKKMTAEWTKIADEFIAEQIKDAKPQQKGKLKKYELALPFKPVYDEDGDETDMVKIGFKRDATWTSKKTNKTGKNTVVVFDSQNNVIKRDLKIGSGSIIQVGYSTPRPYASPAAEKYGVSVRLMSARLIKLVEYVAGGNADAFGFEDVDEDAYVIDENENIADAYTVGDDADDVSDYDAEGNDNDAEEDDADF